MFILCCCIDDVCVCITYTRLFFFIFMYISIYVTLIIILHSCASLLIDTTLYLSCYPSPYVYSLLSPRSCFAHTWPVRCVWYLCDSAEIRINPTGDMMSPTHTDTHTWRSWENSSWCMYGVCEGVTNTVRCWLLNQSRRVVIHTIFNMLGNYIECRANWPDLVFRINCFYSQSYSQYVNRRAQLVIY